MLLRSTAARRVHGSSWGKGDDVTPCRTLLCLGLTVAICSTLLAKGIETPAGAKKPELEKASKETVTALLEEHGKAVKAGDAMVVIEVLKKMRAYENSDFRKPALDALGYRATSVDRKAAVAKAKGKGKEANKVAEKEILEREEGVQTAASRLLANCPDKETGKTLHKLLSKKDVRDSKPRLRARIMLTMGHLGYTKAFKVILNEFRQQADNDVMKAAVLYFGMTKEKRAAVTLTGFVSDPGQKLVHHRARRLSEIWASIRMDVRWALKEITGQEFESTQQARNWVRENFGL
jgi:HEAT repeat protein